MPEYVAKLKFTNPKMDTFLQEWATALGVPVADLLNRILTAAVEGEHYIECLPDGFRPRCVRKKVWSTARNKKR